MYNRISESCKKKEEQPLDCPSQKSPKFGLFLFPEVALQEASEGLAVTGLARCHMIVPLRSTIMGRIYHIATPFSSWSKSSGEWEVDGAVSETLG